MLLPAAEALQQAAQEAARLLSALVGPAGMAGMGGMGGMGGMPLAGMFPPVPPLGQMGQAGQAGQGQEQAQEQQPAQEQPLQVGGSADEVLACRTYVHTAGLLLVLTCENDLMLLASSLTILPVLIAAHCPASCRPACHLVPSHVTSPPH